MPGIIVVLVLLLPFLAHIFVIRVCGLFKQPFNRQKSVIAGFLLGLAPLAVIFYFWPSLYIFLMYSLFGYSYFHFFNMSETARRVHILAQINKTGTFKKDELLRDYPSCDIVDNRLKRLTALGELRFSDSRYFIARGFFVLPAKIVFALKGLLFL